MTGIMKKEEGEAIQKALNGEAVPQEALPQQGEKAVQNNSRLAFDPRKSIVYMHVAILVEAARLAHELLGVIFGNPKYEHTPSVVNKATRLQEILKELAPADNDALLKVCEQMLSIAAPGVDFVSSGVGVSANTSEEKVIIKAEIMNGQKFVYMPLDRAGAEGMEQAMTAALDRLFPQRLKVGIPKLVL